MHPLQAIPHVPPIKSDKFHPQFVYPGTTSWCLIYYARLVSIVLLVIAIVYGIASKSFDLKGLGWVSCRCLR